MSADRLSFEHVAGGPWKGEAETSGFEAKKLVIECTSLFEAMRTAAVFFGELDREPEEDLAKVQAGVSLAEHDQALQLRNETIQRLVEQIGVAASMGSDLQNKLTAAEDKIAELTAKIVELNKPAEVQPPAAQEVSPLIAGQKAPAGTDPAAQQPGG